MTDRVLFIEPDGPRTDSVATHLSAGLRSAGHTCLRCNVGYSARGTSPNSNSGARDDDHGTPQRTAAPVDMSIDRAREWDLAAIRKLRRLILELRPRVIYVMSGDADRITLAASRGLGCRVVLQRRSPLPAIDRWLLSRDAVYLTSSEAQRRDFQRRGLPVMSAAWVDACGSPAGDDRSVPMDKRQVIEELQIPGSSQLFGTVADLVSDDNLRDAIWVSDLLKVVNDDSHLLIFGDGPEWLRLERFRRRVEIEDRVHFMGQVADVFRWLPALDGYWCAAGDDSIDCGMCEALRLGLPMVVSDTAGHRELVQPEKSGLLFPVGNRAQFSRQAFRVLEEPDLVQRMGEAARTRWAERFSPDEMLQRFVDAHTRLTATLPAAA